MIYSSSVLLNLFETAQEIRAIAVNPQTEAEMDKELTRLAIFHLSAPGRVYQNLNLIQQGIITFISSF